MKVRLRNDGSNTFIAISRPLKDYLHPPHCSGYSEQLKFGGWLVEHIKH